MVARRVQKDGATYFGPFYPATAMRETLRLVRAALPAPHLPHQDRRRAGAAVPPVLHPPLQRARAPGWETRGGLRPDGARRRALPRGQGRRPRPAPDAGDGGGRRARTKFERAARPARPDPGAQHGARAAEDDLHRGGGPGHRGAGRARAPRPASSSSSCARAGCSAGSRSSSTVAGAERRRDPLRASCASSTRRAWCRRPRSCSRRRCPKPTLIGEWLAQLRGRARGAPRPPARAASASSWPWPRRTRRSRSRRHLLARGSRQQVVLEELAARARPARSRRTASRASTSPHIQGRETVGSMVVWEDGDMKKDDYKRFKIRTVAGHRRLRVHARGADAGATGGPWRTRACCPTSSCSTAAAASSSAGDQGARGPRPRLPARSPRWPSAPRRSTRPTSLAAARARPRLAGAAGAPADPRRGASLRDHVPQEAPPAADHRLGARPDPRGGPAAPHEPAQDAGLGATACGRPRWPSWPRCPRSPRSSPQRIHDFFHPAPRREPSDGAGLDRAHPAKGGEHMKKL